MKSISILFLSCSILFLGTSCKVKLAGTYSHSTSSQLEISQKNTLALRFKDQANKTWYRNGTYELKENTLFATFDQFVLPDRYTASTEYDIQHNKDRLDSIRIRVAVQGMDSIVYPPGFVYVLNTEPGMLISSLEFPEPEYVRFTTANRYLPLLVITHEFGKTLEIPITEPGSYEVLLIPDRQMKWMPAEEVDRRVKYQLIKAPKRKVHLESNQGNQLLKWVRVED